MKLIDQIKTANNKRKITFDELMEEWLVMKKKEVKESTICNYSFQIQKHLLPEFKGITLKVLENYNYTEFIEDLTQDLASKTVRDIVSILKLILTYGEEKYQCNFRMKNIKAPKLVQDTMQILYKNEKDKIEKYCLLEKSLKSLGIVICLNTGLRIGEICSLKWKNINFEKREISVMQTIQKVYDVNQNQGKVIITSPKTKKSVRNIPISDKLYCVLKELKKDYKEDDYFLSGNEKIYILPSNYRKYFKKILVKNGIETEYKFHSLRHSFATSCVEVGMDVKSLSELLGHSNTKITLDLYVHSTYKQKKKYLEKL